MSTTVHRRSHGAARRGAVIAIAACAVAAFVIQLFGTGSAAAEGEWIALFNGKDLEGWTPKIRYHELGENFANTFRVEDGLLTVAYDQYKTFDDAFGHLFYKTPFSHYRIRVEYRFIGEQAPGGPDWALRNSGIMLHCQAPETMGKNQDFPVSIEVQLLGGDGERKRPTANVCTPGTHIVRNGTLTRIHCINSRSETYHGDQWVTLEAEVLGNESVTHFVNGDPVLEYAQPQLDTRDPNGRRLSEARGGALMLDSGYISL